MRHAVCSVCGRDVRGLDDSREVGGNWFCSHSCLLEAESRGGAKGPTRRHGRLAGVRRFVKWSLIVFGLLGRPWLYLL